MAKLRAVSERDKKVAQRLAKAFGGTPHVQEWVHDLEPLAVDILSVANSPNAGLTSYGTLGLTETPLEFKGGIFPSRIELVGAFPTDLGRFRDIIGGAAFSIMKSRKLYTPGSALPNYVKEWYPKTSTPHLYFTSPNLWPAESLREMTFEDTRVNFLQVFPISAAELEFLNAKGDNALEDRFVQQDIDIFDLSRTSVV